MVISNSSGSLPDDFEDSSGRKHVAPVDYFYLQMSGTKSQFEDVGAMNERDYFLARVVPVAEGNECCHKVV